MLENRSTIIEGVFFVHGRTTIIEDWCPICRQKTKFLHQITIRMDTVEKRKMNCGHEITYIFLEETVGDEFVKVVRKKIS